MEAEVLVTHTQLQAMLVALGPQPTGDVSVSKPLLKALLDEIMRHRDYFEADARSAE